MKKPSKRPNKNSRVERNERSQEPMSKKERFLLQLKSVANDNRRRHRADGPGGNYNGF